MHGSHMHAVTLNTQERGLCMVCLPLAVFSADRIYVVRVYVCVRVCVCVGIRVCKKTEQSPGSMGTFWKKSIN